MMAQGQDEIVRGWKSIAEVLRVSVETAIEWRRDGLPVHKSGRSRSATIFAFRAELIQWQVDRARRARGEVQS